MKEKITIIIYSRKSKYTGIGDSIGNQIELCKNYIKVHYPKDKYDVEIIVFEDEGFSGGTTDRPQFQEMFQLIQKKYINVLICYRLDRISRNIADFSRLIEELSKHKISFISIKEQFDTSTPMGRAMMYIASVFAQLEREVIAERIRDNLLELAKTGTWLGGDSPLGFSVERFEKVNICENDEVKGLVTKTKKASKLVINEEELKIYNLIVSKFEELKSLTKLETYLLNNDIKTRKGAHYSIFTLKWILTNPVYVKNDNDAIEYFKKKGINVFCEKDNRNKFDGNYGFLTYHKTSKRKKLSSDYWIYAVGLHPGIIEGKRWIAIQMLLEKNASKSYRAAGYPKKQTIVAGLIKCKECGSYMRPRNMDKKRKDGTVNYRYSCVLKEKSCGQKCNSKNVIGEKLDNQIIKIIKEVFVPNIEIYKELMNMSIKNEENFKHDELKKIQVELQKKNLEIQNVISKLKYIDVDIIDIINTNLKKLKLEKEELNKKIKRIKKEEIKDFIKDQIEIKTTKDICKIIDLSFKTFELFDLKTKRDIARIFIETIYGFNDHVEIIFSNTKINELQKKAFIPTYQKLDNFF